jgi:hypothetical protein
LVHLGLGRLVEIDGVRADEGGTVIVHLVDVRGALDLENGAHRIDGPICGGAADVSKLQITADGGRFAIHDVIGFGVGVGRGADGGNAGTFLGGDRGADAGDESGRGKAEQQSEEAEHVERG